MKVVILAGGLGSRLSEETDVRPKPLVEIGGRPILWHIMKYFSFYGFNEFIVALGYKGDAIKRYFLDYPLFANSLSVNLKDGSVIKLRKPEEDWVVHLIDTGLETETGSRVKRLEAWLREGAFMATYGDGVCDIDLSALLDFHRRSGCMGTVSAVHPPARFGELTFDEHRVKKFIEKPQTGEGWINGGFMVFEPAIFQYLERENSSLESNALEKLAGLNQLAAYKHAGFWQCMDTVRDKRHLESLWTAGTAPWKVWP